uniref:Membrane magnesium transporter n=1 Tax=Pseudictyota dubia TaxID=2749911 RepID=A0A7R9W276_9STRA|mmetsp:Transcript_29775/g.55377  ORF Transcript_29775/g.55377 Transcript_29775/m.55377 type:complete len:114 (+) Transcript_29775:227-568(+)
MATFSLQSILSTVGALLVMHSTYSCLHYRSILLSAGDVPPGFSTTKPPSDVVIEVLVGFALCLIGQLACGPFLEVRASTRGREVAAPPYRTRDFDIYNNRGKALAKARKGKMT